jgi:hypothetical protein
MAGENETNGQQGEQRSEDHKERSSLSSVLGAMYQAVMRDGSIAALGREAIKDIQDTYYQVAYGQGDHAREPGGPLTPLHSDIEAAREHYAPRADLPSPGDIARGTNFTAAEQGQSYLHGRTQGDERGNGVQGQARDANGEQMIAQNEKTWVEYLEEREKNRGGSGDQNEPFVARILPDEQREQQKEGDRSRGR